MNDAVFAELSAWLTQAGLAGTSEIEIVSGFCERCVATGVPVARALMFIDTLDPVHEGRLLRWGYGSAASPLVDYGRTHLDGLAPSGSELLDVDAAQRWLETPHYKMLQTGESFLRRRLDVRATDEFPALSDLLAAGMTDYVALISRFAPEGVIGEMDGVYLSWATKAPEGFSDDDIAALQRLAPYLALAIKSVSLSRMTGTLMQTYLGRGAGRRVLGGRIVRGIAERIDAVIWFSDLRGFTRITDTAPEQVIPLLNDYFDVIVSAIDGHGGDVVQLVGDGAFAIFTAEDRALMRRGIVCGDRCARGHCRIEQAPGGGRQTDNRYVSRFARRRGFLRQCRKPRTAGVPRHWPGGERGKPHCGDVPFGRSACPDIIGVCRCRRHQAPPCFGGTIRATRRRTPSGAVYARSHRIRSGTRFDC
jgi:adenylate cyclase